MVSVRGINFIFPVAFIGYLLIYTRVRITELTPPSGA
mgnify:CR=1 FL=1